MSEFNDDAFKRFLQEHSKAPPPPINEMNQIKARLQNESSDVRSAAFSWFNLGTALAACFVAVWFLNSIMTKLDQNPISPSIVKTQQEIMQEAPELTTLSAQIPMHGTNVRAVDINQENSLTAQQESTDVDLLMEEWPTMDVGEDYLAWANL